METAHLLALADWHARAPQERDADAVSETLACVIASQGENPAYVMNERWDVLRWNEASELLFGSFGRERFGEANALRYMFLHPEAKARIVDWRRHATRRAGQFRRTSDHLSRNERFAGLIEALRAGSPEFASFWTLHEVVDHGAGIKRIRHEQLGALSFRHAAFQVNEDRALKMVIYVAGDPFTRHRMAGAMRVDGIGPMVAVRADAAWPSR